MAGDDAINRGKPLNPFKQLFFKLRTSFLSGVYMFVELRIQRVLSVLLAPLEWRFLALTYDTSFIEVW